MADLYYVIKCFLSVFDHHLTLLGNLIDLLNLLVRFQYPFKATELAIF
jgi:hypothetical protein